MSGAMGSAVPAVQELVTRAEGYRGKMVRPTMVLLSGLAAGDPEEANLSRLGLTGASYAATSDARTALPDTPAIGRLGERHFTVAAVIEMIHLATLVHDDVLDEAEMRRGSPTIARLRGNEPAVMLGDYLISRAFELCATLGDASIAHRVGQISSRVCEGEIMQLAHRDDMALDETTYYDIIERKTACLIGVAAELGARCSDADTTAQHAAFVFGQQVGIAFQIQDDLLDLIGQERVVGKSLGKDIDKGKLTLPMIHHFTTIDADARAAFAERLRGGAFLNGSRGRLAAVLESTNSIAYAKAAAARHVEQAKAALGQLPASPARAEMERLADAIITRAW
jgi:octaprenyl-diphosphate synthase